MAIGYINTKNLMPTKNATLKTFKYTCKVPTDPAAGTLKFAFSEDAEKYSSTYTAASGTHEIDLSNLGYTACYASGIFDAISEDIELDEIRCHYDIDVSNPTTKVEIWDKNNNLQSTPDLKVLSCSVSNSITERVDTFEIRLDNSDGRYSNIFAPYKDVKIYFGYAGDNVQKIIGLIDRIQFQRTSYEREECILSGRSYEAKLYTRKTAHPDHQNYYGKTAGEIVIDLMDYYLPESKSGITHKNVVAGDILLDKEQNLATSSRNLGSYNKVGEIKNPSFEDGPDADNIDFWTKDTTNVNAFTMKRTETPGPGTPSEGKWSAYITKNSGYQPGKGDYGQWSQTIDASKVVTIMFDWSNSSIFENVVFQVFLGDTKLLEKGKTSEKWIEEIIDVSGISSTSADLIFRLYVTLTTAVDDMTVWIDNIRCWGPGKTSFGQTFKTGTDVDNISTIDVVLNRYQYTGTKDVTLRVYEDTTKKVEKGKGIVPATSILASKDWVRFNLDPRASVSPASGYYFEIDPPSDCYYHNPMLSYYEPADVLADGEFYTVSGDVPTADAACDAGMKSYYITTSIKSLEFADSDTVFNAIGKVAKAFDLDWYIDFDKDMHLYATGSIADNYLFDESENLLSVNIMEDSLRIANYVEVYGSGDVYALAEDPDSQSLYGKRDLQIRDESIRSDSYASGVAIAKLTEWQYPKKSGRVTTFGLPELSPGKNVWFRVPDSGIDGEYITADVTHRFVAPAIYEVEIDLNEAVEISWNYIKRLAERVETLEYGKKGL